MEGIKKIILPLSYGRAVLTGETAKKGYLSVADQGIVSAGNFITGLVLGRYLAPEEFGAFVIAWTTIMIVMSLQNALIYTPMSIIGAQKNEKEMPDYFGSLLVVHIITDLLLWVAVILTAGILQRINFLPISYTSLLFFVFFCGFFLLGQEFYRRLLLIRLDIRGALFNDALTNALRISALLFLIKIGSLNPTRAVVVVGISSLIGCAIGHIQTSKLFKISVKRIKTDFVENWRFGKWVLAEIIPYSLSVQGYTYLTALVVGASAAAALGASQNILNATNILILAYTNLATPMAARRFSESKKALDKFMLKTGVISSIPIIGFYLLAMFFSARLLTLVYKNNYAGYGSLLTICSLYFILSFLNRVLQIYLYAKRKPNVGFYIKTASLVMMLLISYPLLKYYGVYGAAAGTVISQIVVLMGMGTYTIKAHRYEDIS